MATDSDKDEPIINNKTSKGRSFIALATMLGGPDMVRGLNRIMDGLCPDCGELEHETGRCFRKTEDGEL